MNTTYHLSQRAAQRGISMDAIELCLTHGKKVYTAGARVYFLGAKEIKRLKLDRLNYEGLTVITQNQHILTVYKNKEALSNLKKRTAK